MTFKLTFNKPAVRQFIDGEESRALRVKLDGGHVMFMPSTTLDDDTAKLTPRTRGGFEASIEGHRADELLQALENPAGPFFVLRRVNKDWLIAEPYEGDDAPPKFEPHVRVWSPNHARVAEPVVETKKIKRKKAKVAPKIEQPSAMERVRWAYELLSEPSKPGRPNREVAEAKQIRTQFETAATQFVAERDLRAIFEAYDIIGAFLRKQCPNVLAAQSPIKPRSGRTTKAPTPRQVSEAARAAGPLTADMDDEESRLTSDAASKLGIERPSRSTKSRRSHQPFNGEGLVA